MKKTACLFAFLFAACLLVACHPAEPRLTRQGVDAPGAIELLDKASAPADRERALQSLETDRRASFDWAYFWREMPPRYAALNESQRARVVALASRSCADGGFASFARFALATGAGLELAIGEGRACEAPLSNDARQGFLSLLVARVFGFQARPDRIGDMRLLSDLLAGPPSRDARAYQTASLEALSTNRWIWLADALLNAGEGARAARLLDLHRERSGDVRLLSALAAPWLERPDALAQALQKNRTSDVARILLSDDRLAGVTAAASTRQWQEAMDAFAAAFERENAIDPHTDDLERALRTLHVLETLPMRARQAPAFADQLAWHERLMRSLEGAARRSADGIEWLADADADDSVRWIQYRLGEPVRSREAAAPSGVAGNPFQIALGKRLDVRLTVDDAAMKSGLAAYCDWLAANGVAKRRISGERFQWSDVGRPGCVELTGLRQPGQTVERTSASAVAMAFDSALITQGWSMALEAPSFDGSAIDLSTELKWPEIAEEPPPESDAAIAFPILLGFKTHADFLGAQGVHYFVFHYTWRFAAPGLAAVAVASAGYPGGDLRIVERGADSAAAGSFAPRVVSFGGPGQAAPPTRHGGAPNVSRVDWGRVGSSLAFQPSPNTDENPRFLSAPTLRVTRDLLAVAETEAGTGRIRIFVDATNTLRMLTQDQLAKVRMACAGNPDTSGDSSVRACWARLSESAARQLNDWYGSLCREVPGLQDQCPRERLDDFAPRMDPSGAYAEQEGAAGPANAVGAAGRTGRIEMTRRAR